MKALVKTGSDPDAIELRSDHEIPQLPAARHLMVEVAGCGICGTDLHILEGGYSSFPPVILGHEVSGTVIAIGDDVDPTLLGAPVALETFYQTCESCDFCRSGRPNMCDERKSIGSGANGGFAEFIAVPAASAHRLPDNLPVEVGALSEPLACVCQSLFDPTPAVTPGDRVLVIGPGAVGLIAAQVARVAGATVVVAGTRRDESRMSLAADLGFDTVITPGSTADLPAGWEDGSDVVIECSGSGPGMATGLRLIRKRGRFVQMGQTDKTVDVPLALVSFKELTITGGFASTPASWRRAMRLISENSIDLASLATHRLPLEDWEQAFEATAQGKGVKYLLMPKLEKETQ